MPFIYAIIVLILIICIWFWGGASGFITGAALTAIAAILAAYSLLSSRLSTVGDILVVGGGIAGLYASYSFAKRGRPVRLLEASSRWGGRALQYEWHQTQIKLGAGIIRAGDRHLKNLIQRLGLGLGSFQNIVEFRWQGPKLSRPELDTIITRIGQMISSPDPDTRADVRTLNVNQFLSKYFPQQRDAFIHHLAYTDFLDASVADTYYNYPMSERYDVERYYAQPNSWNSIIAALQNPGVDAHLSTNVLRITRNAPDSYEVHTPRGIVRTQHVVLALDQPALDRLIAASPDLHHLAQLSRQIGHVPFTRGFTFHPDPLPELPGLTLTDQPSQRIVPFSPNVLMSVYADNEYARRWGALYSCSRDPRDLIPDVMESVRRTFPELKIPDATDFVYKYWEAGIHYWRPGTYPNEPLNPRFRDRLLLRHFVNPAPQLFLCGEMFSENQGWVEGAVESVDRMLQVWDS